MIRVMFLLSLFAQQSFSETPAFDVHKEILATRMHRIGEGRRKIKKRDIYKAELFTSEPEQFKKSINEAQSSLTTQKAVTIQITFKSDVSAQQLKESLVAGLEKNKISLLDEDIKKFLELIDQMGDVKDDDRLIVSIYKFSEGEYMSFNGAHSVRTIFKGQPNFMTRVFCIWLGIPADSSYSDLKKQLLN